jgi:hypothetical protein
MIQHKLLRKLSINYINKIYYFLFLKKIEIKNKM